MGDGSALKITTAYWHTPGGRALHGKGVLPDVALDAAALQAGPASRFGAEADDGLRRAREILDQR